MEGETYPLTTSCSLQGVLSPTTAISKILAGFFTASNILKVIITTTA